MWLYKADLKSSGSTIRGMYYCCAWSVLTSLGACSPRKFFDSRLKTITISMCMVGVECSVWCLCVCVMCVVQCVCVCL